METPLVTNAIRDYAVTVRTKIDYIKQLSEQLRQDGELTIPVTIKRDADKPYLIANEEEVDAAVMLARMLLSGGYSSCVLDSMRR